MDRINKLKNSNLSEEEVDKILEEMINEKMDQESRERYAKLLKEKHGIERSAPKVEEVKKSSKILTFPNFAKIAASLILLAAAAYFISTNIGGENNKLLSAQAYIEKENLQYMDVIRGTSEESEIRSNAIKAFQNKSFSESLTFYEQIPSEVKTTEDLFYQSYSQLKLGLNQKAITGFDRCTSLLDAGDKLKPESTFYYIISLLQAGEVEKAKAAKNALDKNSWEAKELSKISFK